MIYRRLFTLCTILSLFLFVAAVALWVRSYWPAENQEHDFRGVRWRMVLQPDRLWVDDDPQQRLNHAKAWTSAEQAKYELTKAARDKLRADMLEFVSREQTQRVRRDFVAAMKAANALEISPFPPPPSATYTLSLPTMTAANAFLPLVWVGIRMRRRRRRALRIAADCCIKCGYDLRSSPDRCPECGADRVASPVGGIDKVISPAEGPQRGQGL